MRILEKWHIELNNKNKQYTIYGSLDELLDSGEGLDMDDMLVKMRRSLADQIKHRHGAGHGHEMKPSKELGDRIYEIPVHVLKLKEPPNYEVNPYEEGKTTPEPEVEFSEIPPVSEGYYWSVPKDNASPHIVYVAKRESLQVLRVYTLAKIDSTFSMKTMQEYTTLYPKCLWSKDKIPIPKRVVEKTPVVAVDHDEW